MSSFLYIFDIKKPLRQGMGMFRQGLYWLLLNMLSLVLTVILFPVLFLGQLFGFIGYLLVIAILLLWLGALPPVEQWVIMGAALVATPLIVGGFLRLRAWIIIKRAELTWYQP